MQGKGILIMADTLSFSIAVFIDQVTDEGVAELFHRGMDGLVDDECQSHEREGAVDPDTDGLMKRTVLFHGLNTV